MDKFWQALSFLLPTGWAWPRHLQSVLMRAVKAIADLFRAHEDYVHETVLDWMPHRTINRLDEWENALGLPDPCFGDEQTIQQRQINMLALLRGDLDLPYPDSSADSIGALKRYMARFGYEIDAKYNLPFRVARNRVGQRLGDLNGIMHVWIFRIREPFRVSKHRVGTRLMIESKSGTEALCLLRRFAAGRFELNVIFVAE
jgi:uncharacterized protein YmfQ (DUF2313 family)